MKEKEKFFSDMKKIKKGFTKDDLFKKTKDIRKNIESLEIYKKSKTILFYVESEDEFEVHQLIKDSLKKGKKVILPYIDNKEIFLTHLIEFKELMPNEDGFMQPRPEFIKKFNLKHVNLIVLPGIVFDKKGHRVGLGSDLFDEMINKSDAKKVALAYGFQIVDNLPTKVHDVPVDVIVTEKEILSVASN